MYSVGSFGQIVIGQSVGKSLVFKAIFVMSLPSYDSLSTRSATQMVLQRAHSEIVNGFITAGPNQTKRESVERLAVLQAGVNDLNSFDKQRLSSQSKLSH